MATSPTKLMSAPSERRASIVDSTSAPGSRSLIVDSPSASAAQINARWAIDLSDGTLIAPRSVAGAVSRAVNDRWHSRSP